VKYSNADHIAILVDDLKIAEEWYTEHLKGTVTFRDSKYIRISIQNTNIALIDKKHYKHAHFAILIEEYNDLPLDKGEIVKHRDGTIGVYVKDPFGNYLEYIWYSDSQKKVFLNND
jgi:extradiol dioxygenase family protein|tara:strand:+ start:7833 stop:8180 length:348 start_codon:yes stop_codon:yes gene_type:complete